MRERVSYQTLSQNSLALSGPKTCARRVLIICLIMYLLITALISETGKLKPDLREEIRPPRPGGSFNYEGKPDNMR